MTPIEKSRIIYASMDEDFSKGMLPSYLKPYFDWRAEGCKRVTFTRQQARIMCYEANNRLNDLYDEYPDAYSNVSDMCNDNPWQVYEGFGKDKRLAGCLSTITDDLTELIVADVWSMN